MKQRIQQIIAIAKKTKLVSFDMEYEIPQSYYDDDFHLHGCSFAVRDGDEIVAEYFTEREHIQEVLNGCFNDQIEAVAHFAKTDYQALKADGYTFEDPVIRCTAQALNLLEEERFPKDLGLKVITPQFLGYSLTDFGEAESFGMDSPEFKEYAVNDSIATLKLYEIFKKGLIQEKLWSVYQMTSTANITFGDMELSGMCADIGVAEDLYNKFLALRDEVEEEVYKMIGYVDLNSPKQLGQRLFHEMGFTANGLAVSDKTGMISTGTDNMKRLAYKYPACEAISAFRTANKMVTTYVEPLSTMALYNDDNRIHPLYWLVSKTGRTRCSKPNAQNLPSGNLGKNIIHNERLRDAFNKLNVRDMIVAPEGSKIICADYSSIEYRTAAIASGDKKLLSLYRYWECDDCGFQGSSEHIVRNCTDCGKPVTQGQDLHQINCDIANGFLSEAEMRKISRGQAKAISFLAIFAGGAWRLSQDLKLPIDICDLILEAVMGNFPGLREWHQRIKKIVGTTGEVRDMFGRRRKIDLKAMLKGKPTDKHKGIKKNALNMLVNFGAQAPACVLAQVAMKNIRKRLIKDGTYDRIQFSWFVHDEIGMYCQEDLVEYGSEILQHEMENSIAIGVPTPVEIKAGDTWSLCH